MENVRYSTNGGGGVAVTGKPPVRTVMQSSVSSAIVFAIRFFDCGQGSKLRYVTYLGILRPSSLYLSLFRGSVLPRQVERNTRETRDRKLEWPPNAVTRSWP